MLHAGFISQSTYMMILEQLQREPRLFLAPKCSKIFEFGSLSFFFCRSVDYATLNSVLLGGKIKHLKADNDTHRSERRN